MPLFVEFERVIVIGTLRSPDEQEAISRGSLMTGFHLHFEFTKAPAKERDNAEKSSKGSEADTGAFHIHLKAIQRVVAESFASALIMEETVDWDVNLKMQLKGLASGMRLMQESNASAALPYGDRWDLLWLGHCGMRCAAASSFLLAPHDITAVPSRHLMSYRREPPAGVKNQMRLACQIEEAVGSVAYAVTNEGAQKLLTALLEVAPKQEERFDVVASRLCQTEVLSCFSTYPAIMGRRSVDCEKGQKDSNAVDLNEDCPSGVMFSTLDNLDSLSNSTSKVKSAYQDAVIKEIDPAQFEVPHTMFKWRDDRGEHEISL
ncbi:uncharacterized protein BO95DRAFT_463598 [Aspergillus brunneoviolaceus CBS 621.78]|uniref:Uncharacterized protein n=1 Tax=Aspergillus brunneoviolaceus CBS 621.78 TaxID=1450534 RepID=A0ACD1G955_9EURO|nr:hypothetical protein BO95DRAFT_463598 [Aspergillus brunneoviolaceus CBS 621.78]RAH45810.1 hypothetical protein BO95DRAFT_463598 [Aspergillus brunneoviolaceus CBS 621.78]